MGLNYIEKLRDLLTYIKNKSLINNLFNQEEYAVMPYIPRPIDTSEIILNEEINKLTECLAKNTHEVWALQRIKEGWSYGEKRDDLLKQTPCLVDYEELPVSEKEYDRNTALETLKLIMALGYEITKTHIPVE